METKLLRYRVIIEPDEETGTNKAGFTAYCPTLGIADSGKTVEQATKRITSLITFHLESLAEEGKSIPTPDHDDGLITTVNIAVPKSKFPASYA